MSLGPVGLLLGVAGLLLCTLLYVYFPVVPHSLLGWLALLGLGAPAWIFLEWLGTVVLGARFLVRRSSGVRILLGVPTALAIIGIGWACFTLVQGAMLAAG